jgi:dipeptidyl aminopeptidase/acylaminoacyl peptidase
LTQPIVEETKTSESVFMYFPTNRGWSHQLIRLIGEAHNGGGDFGEINRAASKMKVGDLDSWYSEWKAMGEHVEKLATQAASKGFNVTARQAYFRASNYYRMADFYLDRDDPRELPTYQKHVALFKKAADLSIPKIESVSIPFEGKLLHAYFIASIYAKRGEKLHTLIIFGGADATCEEVYFNTGVESLIRGFHVIMVDGPGQGYTLRFEKLYARFDYEKTVGAAIDFLLRKKSKLVNAKKIGIIGRSMGGYYASRAAAMEKRIKAAVVFDAIFDITEDVYEFFPNVRRAINWDLGARNEEEAREKLAKFNLTGIAEKIECPTLIIHGTEDYVSSPKAAEKLFAAIKTKDKLLKWYTAGHGVSAYRAEATGFVLDWLKEKLG